MKQFEGFKKFAEEGDFETNPVMEETKFRFFHPWSINLASLRDYFGEKIALYFSFLSFLTKTMLFMAFTGNPHSRPREARRRAASCLRARSPLL